MTNDGAGSSSSGGGGKQASRRRSRALFAPQAPLYAVLCSLLLDRLHTACELSQHSTSLPRSLLLRAVGLLACLLACGPRARGLCEQARQGKARQGKAGRPDTAMMARNCCSAASCSGGGQRAVKCLCSQIDRSLRPQVAQACPRFSQRRASAARDHLGLGCDSLRASASVRCRLVAPVASAARRTDGGRIWRSRPLISEPRAVQQRRQRDGCSVSGIECVRN